MQRAVAEHADYKVDQFQFGFRKHNDLLKENVPTEFVVVIAVVHQALQLVETQLTLVLGALQRAFVLRAKLIELGNRVQAGTTQFAVQSTCHAERVVVERRHDTVTLGEDETVERCVVGEESTVLPVYVGEDGLQLFAWVALALLLAQLDGAAVHVELRVADVSRRVVR